MSGIIFGLIIVLCGLMPILLLYFSSKKFGLRDVGCGLEGVVVVVAICFLIFYVFVIHPNVIRSRGIQQLQTDDKSYEKVYIKDNEENEG